MNVGTERRRTTDYSIAESLKNIERSCQANANSLIQMNIKLFGEVEGENEQGRIVRLETKSKIDNKRITALENWRWMMLGAGAVIGFLGHKLVGLI